MSPDPEADTRGVEPRITASEILDEMRHGGSLDDEFSFMRQLVQRLPIDPDAGHTTEEWRQIILDAVDAEAAKRQEAERERDEMVTEACVNCGHQEWGPGSLHCAECQRLRAALGRIRDKLRYRPVLSQEIEDAFNIAAASLDRERNTAMDMEEEVPEDDYLRGWKAGEVAENSRWQSWLSTAPGSLTATDNPAALDGEGEANADPA